MAWAPLSLPGIFPRVCGEKSPLHTSSCAVRGSPPRVRGKGADLHQPLLCARITPACAGKRFPTTAKSTRWRDHPRVCGEKRPTATTMTHGQGSPPRVRGKGPPDSGRVCPFRITPACAGKSRFRPGYHRHPQDHPRVCGEKCWRIWGMTRGPGSPPRVRGKGQLSKMGFNITRITPACAGEKHHIMVLCRNSIGSPPRVRGKAGSAQNQALVVGITPACAGKSNSTVLFVLLHRDHPRVCGEKAFVCPLLCMALGSPPRVRGKASIIRKEIRNVRITPACAGKSRIHCQPYGYSGDHPRVCGEKALSIVTLAAKSGSPPRVRGKGFFRVCVSLSTGITPACAGKSCHGSVSHRIIWDHPRVCGEKAVGGGP